MAWLEVKWRESGAKCGEVKWSKSEVKRKAGDAIEVRRRQAK